MSETNASDKVVTVDEQTFEHHETQTVTEDEPDFPVVDETPTLKPTVEQQKQAKVDANHPDGIAMTAGERITGVTLAQEERIRARDAELERIRSRATIGTQAGREQRTREVAAAGSRKRRDAFQRRAASVTPELDPDRPDPRSELPRAQLAAVNTQARRLATELSGWTQAAIARRLAAKIVDGTDLTTAVVSVSEQLRTAPGTIVPIDELEAVDRKEVSVAGRLTELWDPSHPSIAQVGLLADDSGQTRLTVWKQSDAPWIAEGERVRIHGAARNWYEGRVSLAVTGWSSLHFPERDRWWDA
ncbi:DNA-binding protein [Halorubrum sp. SS5]|nr:DNA-binding protein [Halorubrum sp. SS5]